tara:strand:+ start:1282 stop:1590 length:309 start_codon:yes stop_codon:yes gene_type:complete
MIKTLKKIELFKIENRTSVKVVRSLNMVYQCQNFYKNGKVKGKVSQENEPYFFNNEDDYRTLLNNYPSTPIAEQTLIVLCVSDDKWATNNSKYLLNNMNKTL